MQNIIVIENEDLPSAVPDEGTGEYDIKYRRTYIAKETGQGKSILVDGYRPKMLLMKRSEV